MDASREGERLFQSGRLREERLGTRVRASIQVVGGEAGGPQPSLWSGFTGSTEGSGKEKRKKKCRIREGLSELMGG